MKSQSNMCHPFIGIIIHVIHSIKIPLIRAFDNYRNHAAYSPGDVVFVNDNDYISSWEIFISYTDNDLAGSKYLYYQPAEYNDTMITRRQKRQIVIAILIKHGYFGVP